MIFVCEGCASACFCSAEAHEPDNWPRCHTCDHDMTPEEDQ